MLWFIILTRVCNLKCIYCGNDPTIGSEPPEISYSLLQLKKFLSQDKNPIITFYGGEPLLRINLIRKIINLIPAQHYVIQTNGLFLGKLDNYIFQKLDTILVSIDGRPEVNDYYRGRGTYSQVINEVKRIRCNFRGDLIARMAVSGKSDVFKDVVHLLELGLFDHVHWQIDAFFDYPPASRYGGLKGFRSWVKHVYNPGISKLVKLWINTMKEERRVLGIVPFLGIMKTLLYNEKIEYIRCGAGVDAFAIMPSGKIVACPVAFDEPDFVVGNIMQSSPGDLPFKVKVGEPCTSCDYYEICGGRCLYANKTKLWGDERFPLVCETVKHLIEELKKAKPIIENLIEKGIINEEEFNYPKFNNTTEIIP